MTTLVFIFIGMAIGAALVGAYLLGRERGRLAAIDEVARTMGGRLLGKRRERGAAERAQAEMAVVGETNGDGQDRQAIIAKLKAGDDVDLVREHGDAGEPNAVRVVSRFGGIGRLARADADNLAPYLDSGGRVSASIAHISGGALNVVLSVVAIDG